MTVEDVWRATRSPTDIWTTSPLSASINTEVVDTAPFVTASGQLYVATTRGAPTRELWRADLAPGGGWMVPTPITELNVAGANVSDAWVSPDEHRIYFVSDETGRDQIYVAER